MARPKRSAESPGARERICETFWELLETHKLKEITVGSLAAACSCNRGTFYYHFDDIDDLIYHVIEEEVVGGGSSLSARFFCLTVGDCDSFSIDKHVHRIALIVERGGFELVFDKLYHIVFNAWSAVLCPNGEELSTEAVVVIEFSMSGMLGILEHLQQYDGEDVQLNPATVRLLKDYSEFMLNQISIAQNVSRDELLARSAVLRDYMVSEHR